MKTTPAGKGQKGSETFNNRFDFERGLWRKSQYWLNATLCFSMDALQHMKNMA
tara:strand:+ start:836 stop:994 length:159 start_codon:yes stop_codon:yes gene_type:complete